VSYADSSYSNDNLVNYYLITYISSILGEAIDCSDSYIGFEDVDAPDKSGVSPVIIEADKLSIIDDSTMLVSHKFYKIIGYCNFHRIDYVINGQLEQNLWRKSWKNH